MYSSNTTTASAAAINVTNGADFTRHGPMSTFMALAGYGVYRRFLSPVVFALGLVGNVFLLSAVISLKLYRKSPVFLYLAFISFSDCINIIALSGLLFDVLTDSDTWCTVWYYLLHSANKISVYILIASFIFKLRALCRPLDLIGKKLTRQTVIICSSITIGFLLVDLYTVILKMYKYVFIANFYINGEVFHTYDCSQTPNPQLAFTVSLVNIVVYVVIPGIALICLSVAMLVVLHLNHKRHRRLTGKKTRGVASSSTERDKNHDKSVYKSAKSFASILLVMAMLHLLVSTWQFVEIARYVRPFGEYMSVETTSLGGELYHAIIRWLIGSRFVAGLNFSINFYLQITVSSYFRQAVLPCLTK